MCTCEAGVFLAMAFLQTCVAQFPGETRSGLITALQSHYLTSSVIFVENDSKNVLQGVQLVKQVSCHFLVTSSLPIDLMTRVVDTAQSHDSPPLYVLLRDNVQHHQALKQVSMRHGLSNGRWLIFLDTESPLEDFFKEIYIPLDCVVLVAQILPLSEFRSLVTITEVYHVHQSLPLHRNRVGSWSPGENLVWSTVSLYQRRDFGGITLRGAKFFGLLNVTTETRRKKLTVDEENYSGRLWTILEKSCNFTTEYLYPPDGVYGHVSADGALHGILRMVKTGEADVSVEVFDLSWKLRDFIDFLPSIWKTQLTTYIRRPSLVQTTPDLLLAPFSATLWWIFMTTVLVLTFCLAATWYSSHGHLEHDAEDFSVGTSWFCVLGSFCQQGHDTTPSSWCCRLVYLTSYLTAVILFTAYSAMIISFLAVVKPTAPFTSFQGLLEDGTYKFGVVANSTMYTLFEKATDSVTKTVFSKLIKPTANSQPDSTVKGLQRLCSVDKYAFMTHDSSYIYYKNLTTCDVIQIPEITITGYASLIIAQKSPYHGFLKRKIEALRRFGIIQVLQDRLIGMLPKNTVETLDGPTPAITMSSVMFVLVILAIGIAVAAMFLIMEQKSPSWCKRQFLILRRHR